MLNKFLDKGWGARVATLAARIAVGTDTFEDIAAAPSFRGSPLLSQTEIAMIKQELDNMNALEILRELDSLIALESLKDSIIDWYGECSDQYRRWRVAVDATKELLERCKNEES